MNLLIEMADRGRLPDSLIRLGIRLLKTVAGLQDASTAAPPAAVPLVRLAARPNPFNPQTTLRFSLDVPARGDGPITLGLSGLVRLGDKVSAGTPLAVVHAAREDAAQRAAQALPQGVLPLALQAALDERVDGQ